MLQVLEAHRDEEKDVERAAECCAAAMAGVLPPDVVIRVLNPIIKTGEYPVNQAAVKMLTKLADHEGSKEVVLAQLGDIMPGLLKVRSYYTRSRVVERERKPVRNDFGLTSIFRLTTTLSLQSAKPPFSAWWRSTSWSARIFSPI